MIGRKFFNRKKFGSYIANIVFTLGLLLQSMVMWEIPVVYAACGAIPSASLSLPTSVKLGESFDFTMTFDNSVSNGF